MTSMNLSQPSEEGPPSPNYTDMSLETAVMHMRRALNQGYVPAVGEPGFTPQFHALLADLAALREFAGGLANGNLSAELEVKGPLAGSLKTLQANLRHLTWQVQQVASGDLGQKVDFMGEFSAAFNTMIASLGKARQAEHEQTELVDVSRRAAEDLNRAHTSDEVLDSLATFIEYITPCDAVDILLLNNQTARILRSSGRGRGTAEEVDGLSNLDVPLAAAPALRTVEYTRKVYLALECLTVQPTGLPAADWACSHLVAPILIEGQVTGLFSLLKEQENYYTGDHASRLMAYANQAAIAISRAQMLERLSWFATTDPLTGVPNRRHFYELGERELERAQRYYRPFSVLMLDIDHFKTVNDLHGHAIGDQVLNSVVGLCVSQLRKSDLIGRLGGEEFAFVLPETGAQAAVAIADRLRACIARREFSGLGGPEQVTVSIGVAQLEPGVRSLEMLVARADEALYQAKDKGRNRVEVYKRG